MPFYSLFENYPLLERALKARPHPVVGYGIAVAVAVVAAATALRWLISGQLVAGVPFITYYPAIVIVALAAGFWPGVLAIVLSAVVGSYLFLAPLGPSPDLSQREVASLLLFIFISGINVTIVTLLKALVDRVMAQEQNVRVLLESVPNGIVLIDEHGRMKLVNAATEKLFGYERLELVGRNIEVLVPDRLVDTHQREREAFLKNPKTRLMGVGRDLSGRRRDGSEFPVEIGLNPITRSGNTAVLATVIDISERKRAQESQQLVIRELKHRTQNLFAVFQTIANRTVDEHNTSAEIKHVLNGRIQALARAYTMLADARWEGASLAAILDQQFAGFSQRLKVSGCEIVVSPSAAQQFALIIHELATNALKYGAWSVPDGRVSIEGSIKRLNGSGVFSFLWKESGGPSALPPTRKGFGSVILLDSAKQFGQSVTVNYAPEGLTYELQVDLSAFEASTGRSQGKSNTTPISDAL